MSLYYEELCTSNHYGDSSAPLFKLVKCDNLDIFVYKYNSLDPLDKDINHYNVFVYKLAEQSNLFYKYKNVLTDF